MMQRSLLLLALVVAPGAALAQDFPRYPGLSPTQERLLNPIPLPPAAPSPGPPVPMIVSPAPVVSAPPPMTVFPGSSGGTVNPVDRRERTEKERALPPLFGGAPPPEPARRPDGSKEIQWQTVTLPPAPDFAVRGGSKMDAGAGSEAAARSAIERDGYRQVKGLSRAADGAWHGKALRGNSEVAVTVDTRGNVSAN